MGLRPDEERIMINSRHSQAMVHSALQEYVKSEPLVKMDMYAVSDADGVPEIWGNAAAGILCIQGHPEDLAAAGDKTMLRVYQHIARLSAEYKKAQALPKLHRKRLGDSRKQRRFSLRERYIKAPP